jgi:MFS family permease
MMPVGGYFEGVIGGRNVSAIAALVTAASQFLCAECESLTTLLLCQCMFGVGMGFGYVAPMVVGYKHLPDQRGLVSGVIVGGFGAGSFIFNFVVTFIINPHDTELDDDKYFDDPAIYNRVPTMFRTLGLIFLVLALPGAYLQRDPENDSDGPSEFKSLLAIPNDPSSIEESVASSSSPSSSLRNKTTRQMFRDPLCYVLMLSLFCTAVGGMYMSATYKSFGEDEGLTSDIYFANLGSFGAVFNGLSRVLWGMLADKIGVFNALAINTLCFPIFFLLYNFSVNYETTFFINVCLCFAVYGGNYSLYPTATCKLFGAEHAGSNYGSLFVLYGSITAGAMYELGVNNIAYAYANYLVLGANCFGFLCVLFIRGRYLVAEREDAEIKERSVA